MGLIYPADRENISDALVASLHGLGVMLKKGASLLVHHDAVFSQGMLAAAIKFFRKEPF